MLPRDVSFTTVLLAPLVLCGQICIAGTWIDDFSDRTLDDWGGTWGLKNDRHRAGVNNGRFYFRGKSDLANLSLGNRRIGEIHQFTLEMRFMFRRIEVPEESAWGIIYGNHGVGRLEFKFRYSFGALVVPNTAFVSVFPWGNKREFRDLANARFEYEEEKWYTLKIERDGNRYIFWIENLGLEIVDDSILIGGIKFHFVGRCNVWLDDFSVTGPGVPDGGPGFPQAVLPVEMLTTTWGKLKVRD